MAYQVRSAQNVQGRGSLALLAAATRSAYILLTAGTVVVLGPAVLTTLRRAARRVRITRLDDKFQGVLSGRRR